MTIVRLQHIGTAVRKFQTTCVHLERIGLKTRDFRDDQAKGFQHDSRVLLENLCWVHVVHNWNPESRVFQFLERYGEGLEHIALQTDDIQEDVRRLRDQRIPIFQDTVFDANDGYEAFVYPDDAIGFTVELIQPHLTSLGYPEEARGSPVSNKLGVTRAHHIGAVVEDLAYSCHRFEELFGLGVRRDNDNKLDREARIPLGDNGWLRLFKYPRSPLPHRSFVNSRTEGLEYIALETATIEADVQYLRHAGISVFEDRTTDGSDSVSVFIPPENDVGFTIELIPSTAFGSVQISEQF